MFLYPGWRPSTGRGIVDILTILQPQFFNHSKDDSETMSKYLKSNWTIRLILQTFKPMVHEFKIQSLINSLASWRWDDLLIKFNILLNQTKNYINLINHILRLYHW